MLHKFNNPELRRKLLNPFVIDINPNIITVLAFVAALFAGLFFYYNYIYIGVFFVLLNGFFDILDGEIAKRYKRTSKLGDFLDHVFDRFSDIAILLGITLSSYVPEIYGYSLIVMTLLVSYLGTQAQALMLKRNYGGLIGRADRLFLIIIFGLLTVVDSNMLCYGVLVLLGLSFITFIQRFYKIYLGLK
ncbi:MAG: CDP-alcohol phosphatidyltransferase family protein [Nanoarchaeota archaeon]|nr:CDP-alcohol phosphatidyltransferase family protein [Nanoarchaeota archaeon]